MIRETEQDILREWDTAKIASKFFNKFVFKSPKFCGHDFLIKDYGRENEIVGFLNCGACFEDGTIETEKLDNCGSLEIKGRFARSTDYDVYYLGCDKWDYLYTRKISTQLPVYLIVRFLDGDFIYECTFEKKLKCALMGRRDREGDERMPSMLIPISDFERISHVHGDEYVLLDENKRINKERVYEVKDE